MARLITLLHRPTLGGRLTGQSQVMIVIDEATAIRAAFDLEVLKLNKWLNTEDAGSRDTAQYILEQQEALLTDLYANLVTEIRAVRGAQLITPDMRDVTIDPHALEMGTIYDINSRQDDAYTLLGEIKAAIEAIEGADLSELEGLVGQLIVLLS